MLSQCRSNSTRSAPDEPGLGPAATDDSEAAAAIRVLLAGDQAMVRGSLAHVVAAHHRMTVVSEVGLADAVAAATAHRPDVLVLIAGRDLFRTLTLLESLIAASDNTATLLLTSAHDQHVDVRAVALGVRGLVVLEQPPAVLPKAIETVHAGELWCDRASTAKLVANMARPAGVPHRADIGSLTRRELEIVRLIGEGMRNQQIAERLFISQATVRNHLTSILAKLDLTDCFDLAVFAFRNGLVRFPDPAATVGP